MHALQHRGQESAGICVSDEGVLNVRRGMGLVTEALNKQTLETLPGCHAIGHVRYTTAGASVIINAQPCLLYTSPSPRDVEESRMPSSA